MFRQSTVTTCKPTLTCPNTVFFLVQSLTELFEDSYLCVCNPPRWPHVILCYLLHYLCNERAPLKQLCKLLYSAMCRRSSSLSHFALFPKTLHFHSLQPLIISAAFPAYLCLMQFSWFQLQSILPILVLFSLRQGHHVLLRTALLCNYSWLSATQRSKNNFLWTFNSGSNQAVFVWFFCS